MADENQAQESEQEQEQGQGAELVQEQAEKPQDEPDGEKKKNDGLLMPFLYALLAAVGVFTLVMIIGIVMTIISRPAQPSESPTAGPSTQVAQTGSHQSPDGASQGAGGYFL